MESLPIEAQLSPEDVSLYQKAASAVVLTCMLAYGGPNIALPDIGRSSNTAAIEPRPEDSMSFMTTKDAAIAGTAAYSAYWLSQNGLPDLSGLASLAEQPDETLRATIEQTTVYGNDIYIPLTVVSRIGVRVEENEAGWFDILPLIDGGPVWGTQNVVLYGIGDVDIAIDGKIEAYRDELNPRVIRVNISPFRTWRPGLRMESLSWNPEGDEMSGIGVPSTRDRANRAALVAMQALIANEGCRAASEALIQENMIEPIIKQFVESGSIESSIGTYNPAIDLIELHIERGDERDTDQATIQSFREYYSSDRAYNQDSANPPIPPPQLGENLALELLAELVEEVDSFAVINAAGEEKTIEDLLEEQRLCEQNVLGEVVDITVFPSGTQDIFIGDRDNGVTDYGPGN